MLAAQGSKDFCQMVADEMLEDDAEHCDEAQEEQGGGDLSHRLSPLLSTTQRIWLSLDPS